MNRALTLVAMGWLMLACGDDAAVTGGGGGSSCADIAARLTSCGLWENGTTDSLGCNDAYHELARCTLGCVAAASCEDLKAGYCGTSREGTSFGSSTAIGTCQEGCYDEVDYPCNDGSEPIDGAQRCDGWEECDDGSDEAGCPMFACADGSEMVGEAVRCDGFPDCADGSDETGCSAFGCTDTGQVLSDYDRCDGYEDCADGSDEMGCPTFVCN